MNAGKGSRPSGTFFVLFAALCLGFFSSAFTGVHEAAAAEESAAAGQAVDITHLIKELFPKSTAIGEKESTGATPAWPVYQLGRIIGYAYESKDIVDFPGFSGEQMNFLIGIDVDGGIRGVQVLYHHEPIFMHGLGPQPFLDFLAQYSGHAITEQIVVGKSRGASGNDVTYFDGVTKATVSLIQPLSPKRLQ